MIRMDRFRIGGSGVSIREVRYAAERGGSGSEGRWIFRYGDERLLCPGHT